MSENITVLKDESLGGVMREYREVKRKAAVGELIKIVSAKDRRWPIGAIGTCTRNDEFADGSIDTTLSFEGSEKDGFIDTEYADYVVLEPSDILVIDGARYRMVDRKAAVGERVIITNAEPGYGYKQGGVYVIMALDCDDPCIWPDGTYKSEIYLEPQEYRVLEPVNSVTTPELSALPAAEQAAENIATLAAKVKELEERVTVLEDKLAMGQPRFSQEKADAVGRSITRAIKTPQQICDEIVERAKADVSDLLDRNYPMVAGYNPSIWFTNKDGSIVTDECEFIVNRDKRTVVALIRGIRTGYVYARGTAKCAPNDVINVHIGKAIALRRALGLEVPSEYLSAPNPEEPRVGDVITYDVVAEDTEYVVELHNGRIAVRITKSAYPKNVGALIMCGKDGVDGAIILDDSRMSEAENNAAARKEVAA